MLLALKYKSVLEDSFYLEGDDLTIKRKVDGYLGRYKKHDIVKPYKNTGASRFDYGGIHVPGTRRTISYSWLLTLLRKNPFSDGDVIDHIDGNPSNNSRSNIRIVSQFENNRNRAKRVDNTTGYTGINYNKKAKLYIVRKTINGKRLYESSKTLDEAIVIIEEFENKSLSDGYTDRHGK